MLIARFASRKNRLIKVIRTEKNSSPFEVCLKDNFETKKKCVSFKQNFQIILSPNKLRCFYRTGQLPYLPACCTQRCCTHMQGQMKFVSNEWSRNSWAKKKKNVHGQCSEKVWKVEKKEEKYLVPSVSNSCGKICVQTMWHISQFKVLPSPVYPKIDILHSSQ